MVFYCGDLHEQKRERLRESVVLVPLFPWKALGAAEPSGTEPVSCELPLAPVQTGVRIIIPPSNENQNIFIQVGFSP